MSTCNASVWKLLARFYLFLLKQESTEFPNICDKYFRPVSFDLVNKAFFSVYFKQFCIAHGTHLN